MEVALVIYAIWASVVLIWATIAQDWSGPGVGPEAHDSDLEYIAIPKSLLPEWTRVCPNLVIFDLQSPCERTARNGSIPGSLPLSADQVDGLIRWLPPESKVVFCSHNGVERFDKRTELTFLGLGIEAIYFVDSDPDSSQLPGLSFRTFTPTAVDERPWRAGLMADSPADLPMARSRRREEGRSSA